MSSITVNFEKRQCEVILRKDKIRRILFDFKGRMLKAEYALAYFKDLNKKVEY